MASRDEEVLLLLLLLKKRKRRTRRQIHVHPILCARVERGLYHSLFEELCADGKKFFNYFRMSKKSFDELFGYIESDVKGIDTVMRKSIPAKEKLALTLR